MTARVFVFAVNRGGECFDRADKKFMIFPRGLGEIGDMSFQIIAHQVERFAEIADFRDIFRFDPR